jgi:diguanylate cyclase (GGDEF)-like protein
MPEQPRDQVDDEGGTSAEPASAGAGPERAAAPLAEVLDTSPDGVIVFRVGDGPLAHVAVEWINSTAREWWRPADDDASRFPLRGRLDPAQDEALHQLVLSVAVRGGRQRLRVHQMPTTGNAAVDITVARVAGGRVVAACRDVTHLVEDEWLVAGAYEEAASAQATLDAALDATTDGFAVFDVDHGAAGAEHARLVLINTSGARLLGHQDRAELTGQELRKLFPHSASAQLWPAVEAAGTAQGPRTFRVQEQDGTGRWVAAWDTTVAPVGPTRVVITWRDASDDECRRRRMAEVHEAAVHAATHDPLTGLANRSLLLKEIGAALASPPGKERFAAVYADLDQFKLVNDRLGHAAGDEMLISVSHRLSQLVRRGDTVARLGGDEFVLLLRGLPTGWDAQAFVERAHACVEQPLTISGTTWRPRASFGVLQSVRRDCTAEELLQEADRAMYQDKQCRRYSEDGTTADR